MMIWWSYNLFYVVWMLNNLHTSLSSKFDLLKFVFWDFAKGFSYLRLCFEFLKGLLHLIWWICGLFMFVSPLTFTLQTLKLMFGESWDLCEFSWLCMLMRTHYVMFYMIHKLCMLMRTHYTMFYMFHKLCMHMRDFYAMFYMFHKLCMHMRDYYAMFYMFHKLCMLMRAYYVMFYMSHGLCMFMQDHLTMLCKFNGLCMFILPCYASLMDYACLCKLILPCYASLMDYAYSPYHVMHI